MGFLKSVNKQVKRTRDWIFNALLSLLDEKKYEDIKIANITDKAGVARQSFYRNYDGKDDIISKFIENLFDEYTDRLAQIDYGEYDDSAMYKLFFDIMYEYRDDLIKLKNASLSSHLYNNFWSYSNSLIEAFYQDNHMPAEKEYFLKYQLGGIIAVAVEWVYRDMDSSTEELGMRIQSITEPISDDEYYLPMLIKNRITKPKVSEATYE